MTYYSPKKYLLAGISVILEVFLQFDRGRDWIKSDLSYAIHFQHPSRTSYPKGILPQNTFSFLSWWKGRLGWGGGGLAGRGLIFKRESV